MTYGNTSGQWYVNGKPVAPPPPPTQMDRIESLLAAILAAVTKDDALPRVQLPPAYTEQAPPSFSSLQGMVAADDPRSSIAPSMGRTITEHAPPLQTDPPAYAWMNNPMLTVSGPLMGALPLPPARPAGSLHVSGPNGELPDSAGTPGAINADVTEATLKETIGTPGWTARVRPNTAFTDALKAQISIEYGLTGSLSEYECDHLIPLCCGGSPTSQLNLWNQRRAGINGAPLKDITEVLAQHAILAGHISLQEAQDGFRHDWTALHMRLTSNPQVMRLMMAMEPPPEEP